MRLMSRQVDYAANVLCLMAKKSSVLCVSDIEEALDMPRSFIRETMRRLAKAGILHSVRGKHGGFTLACPPSEISIWTLMDVFNDTGTGHNCVFRKLECPRKAGCRLRVELQALDVTLRRQLEKITIASLIAKAQSPPCD